MIQIVAVFIVFFLLTRQKSIVSAVPEDLLMVLDAKKTAKENWEILRQWNLDVD
ncbi:unnamed protein product [Spirodela intermedia]|uniref:Uncharacterized protein n=1 Tax=Spirodela intermedia TaxID=51605 RepID=A0A7I8J8K4_SPIIN|nr:unnamed protein product [Spirodela intermedia]CAA6666419.1 unnamed protein product [Spirodela intermedia]